MSGGNPYAVNGYSNTNATNSNVAGRYGNPYAQQNNPSTGSVNSYASRERRRPDEAQPPYHEERPQPPYATHQRYGSGEYGIRPPTNSREAQDYNDPRRDRKAMGPNPNSAINGYRPFSPRRGPASSKPMDEVLTHIQSSWRDMSGDDCVPVQVALKLMDPSSLGLADKEPDFQQTHLDLQRTLKSIVNEHHQDFNSSIGTYHKIQASIQASQSRVRYLKQSLAGAQGGLLSTKPELKGLATTSQELDDTLQLLGQIENIQAVPEKLEARISEKRFLTAVDVLLEALRLVRKSELDGIGAVTDLRTYFAGQEHSLTDILVEELHDHLYLKSPYCQDRWKAKSTDGEEKDAQASMATSGVNPWDKPVYHYLAGLDTKTPMAEDASRNPEADTFYYIHMIVESLTRLGRLDDAITRIEQRMPVELYKVVDKTNDDVDARHPSHLRGQLNKENRKKIPLQTDDTQNAVLSDFLWTLYSKFEAIAESHRVLHEVVAGVVAREQLSKPETYTGSFKELWKLYQMEMRSLLHDYLATDGDTSLRNTMSTTAGGDVFARNQRDRSKRMFKLAEIDQKSSDVKNEQEELDEILKTSVPGLVSKTRGKTGIVSSSDRSGQDSTAAGHKLLVEPSVFNMTILLPPSLAFLQHLKDVVPVGANIPMSTLTSFLDDFLVNIFHPQLEEAVTELSTQSIIDIEAFSQDSQWSKYSPRPIFKGTAAFMSLVRAFSGMLSSIPQDQIFTQLIISQLVTYYDKCNGYYKAMVSRLTQSATAPNASTRTLKAAAAYAESGNLTNASFELMKATLEPDGKSYSSQVDKEVQLLLAATKSTPLSSYDIISDPRSVHNLSLLYNSMQWLSSMLAQLRHVDSSAPSKTAAHSRNPSASRRWTLIASLKPQTKSSANPIQLPLTRESVIPFDTILSSFRTLAYTALITLHIDIRCGIVFQLSRLLGGSTVPSSEQQTSTSRDRTSSTPQTPNNSNDYPWLLPTPPASASPLILELNNDLISFDTNISSYLGPRERKFINHGLSRLVDRLLILGADWIGVMNEHGVQRMQIDALVLQQNLRNITAATPVQSGTEDNNLGLGIASTAKSRTETDDGLLTLSQQYYNLFLSGPEKILSWVQDKKSKATCTGKKNVDLEVVLGYTYDELRTLIELTYSSKLKSSDWEESVKAKRAMGDALLRLGELMWDSNPSAREESPPKSGYTSGGGGQRTNASLGTANGNGSGDGVVRHD